MMDSDEQQHANSDFPSDTVIDRLFGGRLGEIGAEMQRLEEQSTERIDQAESAMHERVESLERNTWEEFERLSRASESVSVVDPAAADELGRIEDWLADLGQGFDRQFERAQKELQDGIDKAAATTNQLRQSMQQDIADFKSSLRGRAELHGLFAELEKRLEAS